MRYSLIVALGLLSGTSAAQEWFGTSTLSSSVKLAYQDQEQVVINFTSPDLQRIAVTTDSGEHLLLNLPNEGFIYSEGLPILPAISRFVVVPPDKGIELVIDEGEREEIPASIPPAICTEPDPQKDLRVRRLAYENNIFPPVIAEVSEPFIIRGVRLVRVTTYPVQYDSANHIFIFHPHIQTELHFTEGPVENPVYQPIRRNRSYEFLNFISQFAINGDIVGRDDPDRDRYPQFLGHYLIVTHPNCLRYIVPFIEWRRKGGYKVDILVVPQNQISNPDGIKNLIRTRYNSYLNQGLDPFDQIMLVGDHPSYDDAGPAANWILTSFQGNPIWPHNTVHDDWRYACLEGNDLYPECGVARWIAGSEPTLALFLNRTLSYETNPYMQDTRWFTRGAVYSQRWGGSWHISLHTNVRWGVEVLRRFGMTDIRFQENYQQYDGDGQIVGPFILRQYNDGVNVMIGRAENYYFRNGFPANNNVIYPIDIDIAGHHEWSTWWMMRTGDAQNLKGPVAATTGWGGPQTLPMSVVWLEVVNGFLLKGLSFGWSRVFGVLSPEQYIPNFAQTYSHLKTDIVFYGDPYIRPWSRVPTVVTAQFTPVVTTRTRLVEALVTTLGNDPQPVPGAFVTLYFPGNMPPANDERYATYNGMWSITLPTDGEGRVKFIIPEDRELVSGTRMYLTVTGKDIKPFFGERVIQASFPRPEITGYQFQETDGNGDEAINPGERWSISITVANLGQEELLSVEGRAESLSPFIEIENDDQIWIGDIRGEEEVQLDNALRIHIYPSAPDSRSRPKLQPYLKFTFTSGDSVWVSALPVDVRAPHLEFVNVVGGNIIPDTVVSLNVQIVNRGSVESGSLTAELRSLGMGVTVIRAQAQYPSLQPQQESGIEGQYFVVAGNTVVVPGWKNPMMLILFTQNGFRDTTYFELQVSRPRSGAPQGPDGYGYICFDDTDTLWRDMVPIYNWVEIDPREQGFAFRGSQLELNDQDVGSAVVVPLPFQTQFYGIRYDTITVARNGFISMGRQPLATNFQNWPMDRAIGGGVGMIAPFWDDLRLLQNGRVYTAYDQDNGRFIIQWSRLRHATGGNTDLTFQVILYDADVWITETGDPNIIFQYKSISQSQGGGTPWWEQEVPYASVGISSPDGTTGISYTFNNQYPVTSAPLQNRRALLFSTSPRYRACVLYGLVFD
ncbi:MAG: C25 family cysteine peptidase, partial [bacterium]